MKYQTMVVRSTRVFQVLSVRTRRLSVLEVSFPFLWKFALFLQLRSHSKCVFVTVNPNHSIPLTPQGFSMLLNSNPDPEQMTTGISVCRCCGHP